MAEETQQDVGTTEGQVPEGQQVVSSPESTSEEPQFNPDNAQEYFEAYRNQQDWQRSNTQRAQELAEQTRVNQEQMAQERTTLAQQVELANRLAQQAEERKAPGPMEIPDALDRPEDRKRWDTEQFNRMNTVEQRLQALQTQQQGYANQWATRLTSQALNAFKTKHPELTESQVIEVSQVVRNRVSPTRTEDGVGYYDVEQLEDGLELFMAPQRVQEARQQGREEIVNNARAARGAQAVSGRRTGASTGSKDLGYYVNHYDEFERLPAEQRASLMLDSPAAA